MKKVQLITDGACLGNPGPGGWACILRYKSRRRELFGSEPQTTNNRMELTAAVRGLSALKEACEVEVITDSEYLKNGVTEWIRKWKRNGWKNRREAAREEPGPLGGTRAQVRRHKTRWTWTKGHASHEDNNRADELAARAAREQSSDGAATDRSGRIVVRCPVTEDPSEKTLAAFSVVAPAALSQTFSFGVKGGVPLADAFKVADTTRYFSDKAPYVIGPAVEVHLPLGLSAEVDLLYRNLQYNSRSRLPLPGPPQVVDARTTGQVWELPLW